MDKFFDLLLGTNDMPTYFAGFFFALIGLFIHFMIKVKKRNVQSPATPKEFNWSFFVKDNLIEVIFNIVLIFTAMRFCIEIMGVELTMWSSFIVGFTISKIINKLIEINKNAR